MIADDSGLPRYRFQKPVHDNWYTFEFPIRQLLVRLALWKSVWKAGQWPQKAKKDEYSAWEDGCEKSQAEIAVRVTAEVVRESSKDHSQIERMDDLTIMPSLYHAEAVGACHGLTASADCPSCRVPAFRTDSSVIHIVARRYTSMSRFVYSRGSSIRPSAHGRTL